MASILLVEDYVSLQSIYKSILEAAGHKVTIAEDGREALDSGKEHDFDLIILDMLLKEMNGLDFLRQYDQRYKHPDTKIIVFSNIENPKIVKQAMDLGVSKYLIKSSFAPREIIGIVDEVLQEKPDQK